MYTTETGYINDPIIAEAARENTHAEPKARNRSPITVFGPVRPEVSVRMHQKMKHSSILRFNYTGGAEMNLDEQ